MKTIFGKQVYESLREVIDPRHTAIVIVDMQKDYCSLDGYFDKAGHDLTAAQEAVPNLIRLIDEGRKRRVKIAWAQNTTLKNGLSDSPGWLYLKARLGLVKPVPYTEEGTWGQEFVDGLEPQLGDLLVKKHRSGAFVSTDLDLILRSNGIESLIVTGTVSHGCVEATARGALDRGYYVVYARDAICSPWSEMHEAALNYLPLISDVVSTDEIIKIWAES